MAIFQFPPAQATGPIQPYGNPSRFIPGESIDLPPIDVILPVRIDNPWGYAFIGGAAPYQPHLFAALLAPAVVVTANPPYSIAVTASIVGAWQPDPWTFVEAGPATGTQPYAPRQLNPSVTAVRVDNPPSNLGGPTAEDAEIIGLAQPDPWTFTYNGPVSGNQPYGQRQLNPSLLAVTQAQPFVPAVIRASIVAGWQPDPWTQPYTPKQLSPAIPGQSVNQPPFTYGGPYVEQAEEVALAQPDPWTFLPAGSAQPYAPRKLSPGVPGFSVDPPPVSLGGPIAEEAEIVGLAQPDPWTYVYNGPATGLQPYAPRKLSPAIPGQSVNQPPFDTRRLGILGELIATAQPDAWVYIYNGPNGGTQPYAPRQLSPAIPGQSADPPPPSVNGGPTAIKAELVSIGQPDPWSYTYNGPAGGLQPYAPRQLPAALLAAIVTTPPFTYGGPYVAQAEIVGLAQPDPWSFTYNGPASGRQPYGPRQLPPAITAVEVDPPPFAHGGPIAEKSEIAGLSQPDPWAYLFNGPAGGLQPYAPRLLPAALLTVTTTNPPFTYGGPVAVKASIVSIAQPDPWTYPYTGPAGGLQPYAARQLPSALLGVEVDQPSLYGQTSLRLPNFWTFAFVGGPQPYGPRPLSPALMTGATVNNPPFTYGGPYVEQAEIVSIAQPDPWNFFFAPRKLSPGIPGQSVNNPPFDQRRPVVAELISLAQPDQWSYIYNGPATGLQPYAPRQLNPSITAVEVDNPPFDQRRPSILAPAQPDLPYPQRQLSAALLVATTVVQNPSNTAAIVASIIASWIDPSAYPFAPRKLSPGIPGQSVDQPPFTYGGPIAVKLEIVGIGQPDPWVYVYNGPVAGRQPYAPRQLSPGTPGQSVDQPPFKYGGPISVTAEIVGTTQPDPWVYLYNGPANGTQPYAQRLLSPGVPGQSVNNPPFAYGGPFSLKAEIVGLSQPDPWTYSFLGAVQGLQPYGPKQLNPSITAVVNTNPPFTYGGPVAVRAAIVAVTQPDPWVYIYNGVAGGSQPYQARHLPPTTTAVEVDNPPFDRRGPELRAELAILNQIDPWGYSFQGAAQPYQGRGFVQTPPAIIVPVVPPPGAGKRYLPPTDYLPEPAWDERPRRPIRKRKVVAPAPAPKPSGPPPLPPLSIFGTSAPLKLPTFSEYTPTDPLGMKRQMHGALDMADALAAVRALNAATTERQENTDEADALAALKALGIIK